MSHLVSYVFKRRRRRTRKREGSGCEEVESRMVDEGGGGGETWECLCCSLRRWFCNSSRVSSVCYYARCLRVYPCTPDATQHIEPPQAPPALVPALVSTAVGVLSERFRSIASTLLPACPVRARSRRRVRRHKDPLPVWVAWVGIVYLLHGNSFLVLYVFSSSKWRLM